MKLRPCEQHTNISGAYRALLTEEEYMPDGKPEVGAKDLYFCLQCGATFRNDMDDGRSTFTGQREILASARHLEAIMSRSKKLNYHELAKNDPNFHDVQARILLEAAHDLDAISKSYVEECSKDNRIAGMVEASSELRRMASSARRTHKKVQDKRRQESRDSEVKAKAFGY